MYFTKLFKIIWGFVLQCFIGYHEILNDSKRLHEMSCILMGFYVKVYTWISVVVNPFLRVLTHMCL